MNVVDEIVADETEASVSFSSEEDRVQAEVQAATAAETLHSFLASFLSDGQDTANVNTFTVVRNPDGSVVVKA